MSNKSDVVAVTIAQDATYSGEIDMRDYTLLSVLIPATITGSRLRVAKSAVSGGTFKHIQADDCARDVTADEWCTLTGEASGVWAGGIIKLFFDDGADSAQAQAAARSLTVIKGRG